MLIRALRGQPTQPTPRAWPGVGLCALIAKAGLPKPRQTFYRLEGELDGLLSRSFPKPGDADRIRALFRASLADDALGIETRRVGEQIHYGFPVAVLAARRA